MTPERWRRVEEIFHAALSRVESERMGFLAQTCAGDLALRREVELLLAHEVPDGFLDGPAVAAATQIVSDTGASMLTGWRLGTYQVHERIGVGGMGEVYRARDMKLGRDVAIKILPRVFTSDPDRLAPRSAHRAESSLVRCGTQNSSAGSPTSGFGPFINKPPLPSSRSS